MELQDKEQVLSTCCGAKPIGDTHESEGHHMGMCSDCKDHAEFTLEDELPEEPQNVAIPDAAVKAKAREALSIPLGELLTKLGALRYYYVNSEHLEQEAGNAKEQHYCRGAIDAIDAAYAEIKSLIALPFFKD